VKSVKVTILVDNNVPEHLVFEHGLSFWIETAGLRILFDTGQGTALSQNASILEVPLHEADILVLSHGHYDHTGNLPLAIESAPSIQVYCHPGVTIPRYAVREGAAKPLDMPAPSRTAFETLSPEQIHWAAASPLEIVEGIGVTGPIPRHTEYENTGGPFFLDRAGEEPDPIEDDMAMWVKTSRGIVVILGCSHAGVVNTLHHIQKLTDGAHIHAVIGGFHLVASSRRRIENTIDDLKQCNPDIIIPCHCTGEAAMMRLKRAFNDQLSIGRAGDVYLFGDR
jgi:7,8-dihydropterin-6-yl-methyl-4-(beta-D-ribofuranosyl)aminobenzene 5'-phosphate synthase